MVHFIVLKGGAKNYLYLFGFQRIIAQPLFATMHCYHFSLVVRGVILRNRGEMVELSITTRTIPPVLLVRIYSQHYTNL